jgi:hypothetical protein
METDKNKERMTVQLSKEIIERMRDVVYWERMTLAQFVEEAIDTALSRLEHHRGQPYPKRKDQLKRGRPMK